MCLLFSRKLALLEVFFPTDVIILSAGAPGRDTCLTWEIYPRLVLAGHVLVLPWNLARHWHRIDIFTYLFFQHGKKHRSGKETIKHQTDIYIFI